MGRHVQGTWPWEGAPKQGHARCTYGLAILPRDGFLQERHFGPRTNGLNLPEGGRMNALRAVAAILRASGHL